MCFGGGSKQNTNYNPAPYSTGDAWKQVSASQESPTPEQLARSKEQDGSANPAPSGGSQTAVPLLGRSLKPL